MLNSSAAEYGDHATVTEKAHHFPIETFETVSREELLAVLWLMHRILDADKKRDVERIVAELPKLFTNVTNKDVAGDDACVTEDDLAAHPPEGETTYHVLTYLFSCLSRAKTRIGSAGVGQTTAAKNTCHLSPRELTVLLWMKEGKTNWEIARILGLSERTVRFHVGSIFEKLDVTSRTQAVARALGAGLIAS